MKSPTFSHPLLRSLRLDYLHHRIALGLVGVGMVILVGTIVFAPTIASLDCERKAEFYSLCTLKNYSLIGIPVRQVRLEPLTGAQAFPDVEMSGWSNRVMLYRSEGRELPFTIFSTDSPTVKRSVLRINAFLGNPTVPNFRYTQLVPWPVLFSVLAGSLLLLGSGLMLFKIQ
jgi:hypothetical protein